MRFLTLATLVLALAACDSGGDTGSIPTSPPVTPPPTTPPDTTPPSVQITFPAANAVVTGDVAVRFTTSEAGTTTYLVDGTVAPYGADGIDTGRLPDGSHTLAVQVRDAAGNVGTSPVLALQFRNDSPGVSITSYLIESIPPTTPNGTGWDVGSPPDVYATVYDDQNVTLARSVTLQDVAPSSFPRRFTFATPLRLDLSRTYYVAVYDEDVTTDDLMFSTNGLLTRNGVRSRPATVTLTGIPSGTAVLSLSWDAP